MVVPTKVSATSVEVKIMSLQTAPSTLTSHPNFQLKNGERRSQAQVNQKRKQLRGRHTNITSCVSEEKAFGQLGEGVIQQLITRHQQRESQNKPTKEVRKKLGTLAQSQMQHWK